MTCIYQELEKIVDGVAYKTCFISNPYDKANDWDGEVDAADVAGLNSTDVISIGSIFQTPSQKYMAFEENVFTLLGREVPET